MKIRHTFRPVLSVALVLLLYILSQIPAHAQTTAFSYQGRLNINGAAANGVYDLKFQVFDALSGGSSVGGTANVNGVGVTNGLFTTTVDLGSTPFTGPARWLEVRVSTNGAGVYSTLSPRQLITATPYSIYANTAGTVTNGGIGSAQLQNNSITTAKIASGQVVKTLNGLTDNVSIAAGANVTLMTNLNSLQISAPAGGLALPYSGSVATGGAAFSVSNSLSGNYGQLGKSGSGVYGNGSGTDSSAVRGEAGSGAWGVFGTASERDGIFGSTTASGANGYAGVRGKVDTADGVGVRGNHVPSGNYGRLGTASYGVQGVAATAGSAAVDGPHIPSGHHGQLGTASEGAIGLHGPSGNYGQLGTANEGVFGDSSTAGGMGVRGFHALTGNEGQLGTSSKGVFGYDNRGGSGQTYAVYGSDVEFNQGWLAGEIPVYPAASVSPGTRSAVGGIGGDGLGYYAGYFYGNVKADGWLSVNSFGGGGSLFRRSDTNGVLISFQGPFFPGEAGNISVVGGVVTYNAFTGSHYAWTGEVIKRGALVSLTGTNRYAGTNVDSEIVYGIATTARANDARCLGTYLDLLEPAKPVSDANPHLVMAVGNGDMWVTEGNNSDLEPGNYLISSDVRGCAMKDDPERFPVGYICARAGEGVKWSEIDPGTDGVKRKKISVLFENFERHSASADSGAFAAVQKLNQRLEQKEAEIAELKSRLAKLEEAITAKKGESR